MTTPTMNKTIELHKKPDGTTTVEMSLEAFQEIAAPYNLLGIHRKEVHNTQKKEQEQKVKNLEYEIEKIKREYEQQLESLKGLQNGF